MKFKMVWDREDHPEIVTGVRAVYKTTVFSMCPICHMFSNTVHDFLGRMYYCCRVDGPYSYHMKYWRTELLEKEEIWPSML